MTHLATRSSPGRDLLLPVPLGRVPSPAKAEGDQRQPTGRGFGYSSKSHFALARRLSRSCGHHHRAICSSNATPKLVRSSLIGEHLADRRSNTTLEPRPEALPEQETVAGLRPMSALDRRTRATQFAASLSSDLPDISAGSEGCLATQGAPTKLLRISIINTIMPSVPARRA